MTTRRGRAAPRSGRWSRVLLPVVTSVVIIGILFVGIFPVRAILDQRAEIESARRALHAVEARNAELDARVEALGTDAEIERLAREHYNLGRPGEEVYAILPSPASPPPVPDAWPFRGLSRTSASAPDGG